MKLILAVTTLLAFVPVLHSQERLNRAEALKYAFFLSLDLKQMLNTPIPTDPDIKKPVALRSGNHGGMLLPESKLTPDTMAKAGSEVIPVGQLWTVRVAPMVDGQVVPSGKLRPVQIRSDQGEATAFCYALGVQKDASGTLNLLVYGKSKEPLLRAPLRTTPGQSANPDAPCDMSAEEKSDGAELTVKVLGKYQASFMLTVAEP